MNKNRMTTRRFAGAALAVSGLLCFPSIARADVGNVSIAVNGLICPVCAHSLNMGLRRMNGVKSVKVNMDVRVNLEVTLRPQTWIEPARLFQQISQVGYRARKDEVKLRLRGTATAEGEDVLLTMRDVAPRPVSFRLSLGDAKGKRGDEIRQTLAQLRDAAAQSGGGGQNVEAEGWWRPAQAPGQPATLLLTQVRIVPGEEAPAKN